MANNIEQSSAQKLATQALQQANVDIYTAVDDLFSAIELILLNSDLDPKQVLPHLWAKASQTEQKILKGFTDGK